MNDISNEVERGRARVQDPAAPEGLWDILPARAKKRRALESRLRASFEAREYGEVISPSFEFYENLAVETGKALRGEMVRFMGTDGRLLALRPEMTTSIARVAAQRLRREDEPHRLYYIANVFREHSSKQGQPREFRQAGVERIGGGSPEDDAEIVLLFIETLAAAGLNDFKVGLGRIDFLGRVLEELELGGEEKDGLRAALAGRNLVRYKELVRHLALGDEVTADLLVLPGLSGDVEVLERAQALSERRGGSEVLAGLRRVYEILSAAGVADRVILDLGIVRDFDYYTGIIFEAYTPALGAVLGGGGRYDNLLAEFGYETPAAGFALGLERLESALAESGGAT